MTTFKLCWLRYDMQAQRSICELFVNGAAVADVSCYGDALRYIWPRSRPGDRYIEVNIRGQETHNTGIEFVWSDHATKLRRLGVPESEVGPWIDAKFAGLPG